MLPFRASVGGADMDGQDAAPVSTHEVTRLLQAWGSGDRAALEQLTPLVYNELHRLAHSYMTRERSGQTLQTTGLVHEVYLRLVDVENIDWQNRSHFYGICARLMRRILVDFARSRNYQKRGGHFPHVELEEAATVSQTVGSELLAVDDALKRLAAVDSRKSEVVELRFFGGLTVAETAAVLRVSEETVARDWKLAKAWLLRELGHEASP
ncbi:MAG TPA: sigma-70 family RNA polymerase sigma factor [Acidobacteriota bacterium]|nr:sigma-70 family RNA polymerase sigma factor [Acidobacteriota bacterium]